MKQRKCNRCSQIPSDRSVVSVVRGGKPRRLDDAIHMLPLVGNGARARGRMDCQASRLCSNSSQMPRLDAHKVMEKLHD